MYAIAIFVNDNDIMHICIWVLRITLQRDLEREKPMHSWYIYISENHKSSFPENSEPLLRRSSASFSARQSETRSSGKFSTIHKLTQKSGVTMSHCVTLCHTVTHCVTLWHGWRLPKILVHWSKPTPRTLVCHMKEIEKTQSFIFAESAKFAFLHFFIFAFMHLHLVCRFASLPNVHFAK